MCGELIPKKSEAWGRYRKKKYCSNKCQTQSLRKNRIVAKCTVCGKMFEYRVGQQTGAFCSSVCAHQYYKKGKEIKCCQCGKVFYRKQAGLIRNQYNFCSTSCQLKWQKSKKTKYECKICGKVFFAPKSQNRVTCSNHCNGVLVCKLQANKKGLNKLELAGHKILLDIGIKFQEQVLIEKKFLVDVFILENKIVVQWDGEYWHSLPKRAALDKSQDAYMKKCGYKVLRFSEKDEYNNTDRVKEAIYESVYY